MKTGLATDEQGAPFASTVERETKLLVDDSFRLPRLRGRALPRRVFTSTYYDTPDHCLARAHVTLRYRLEGRLGAWQLKLPLNGSRREIEVRGEAGQVPDVFTKALVVLLEGKSMVRIATLRTWRTGVRVPLGGRADADVVLDSVSVMAGGRVIQQFSELEIEWLHGEQPEREFLTELLKTAGAKPHDGRPKLFRALSLAYDHSRPLTVHAPLSSHLCRALTMYVQALKRFDPGTRLGGEPEDLHQMRVAVRRLRAVLRSARRILDSEWADPLMDGLSWLGRLFGYGRDLDVQIEYFRNEAKELKPQDRRPIARFVVSLEEGRRTFQQLLIDEMKSAAYLGFLSKLELAVHQPAVLKHDLTLADIAARQYKSLCKTMRRLPEHPSNEELHRVRIKAKRARYAAELAEPFVGKRAARFARSAKSLQDLLGMHQDAVLAEQYGRDLVARIPGERAACVAELLVARAQQRRKHVRNRLPTVWRQVKKRGKKAWR
ncbi:CHAD domain-containing protein [Petrachloros mirabilis]